VVKREQVLRSWLLVLLASASPHNFTSPSTTVLAGSRGPSPAGIYVQSFLESSHAVGHSSSGSVFLTVLHNERSQRAERKIAVRRLERNAAGTITTVFNRHLIHRGVPRLQDVQLCSISSSLVYHRVPLGLFVRSLSIGIGFSHFDSLALTYQLVPLLHCPSSCIICHTEEENM